MRVSAEFEHYETALEAHKALVYEGEIDGENIELRSPYPVFEEPLPPHRHRPMRIRNWVRFLWACGGIGGYSMVAYCQKVYPIFTGGHRLVPIPINAIITYECAQITALVMTATFFFIETKTFRQRPIPQDEDLAVGNGDCVLVVDGPKVESARGILERMGARTVRTFSSICVLLGLLLLLATQSGCKIIGIDFPAEVRMRSQPAVSVEDPMRAIRDSKVPNAPYEPGLHSMPTDKDPDMARMPEPYGRILEQPEMAAMKRLYPALGGGQVRVPPGLTNFANPMPDDKATVERGKILFEQNCIFCHGAQGKGDGPVGQVFAPTPANLSRPDLVKRSDGDLYWIVTVGPTTMPPFGAKMSAADRFTIVRYIRKLQHDAAAAEAPPAPAAGSVPQPAQPTTAPAESPSEPAASSSP